MSRTNPDKHKRRAASTTLLVFGEGLDEEMLLKHLRKIYSYNTGVSVTVKKGKGGSALDVIMGAHNDPAAFDNKIVVLDNDKNSDEMELARNEAKKQNIQLIEHTPCLEAILLQILTENDYSGKKSSFCKSQFESNYISKKKRAEPESYEKLFPKALLDDKRASIPALNILIKVMEGT